MPAKPTYEELEREVARLLQVEKNLAESEERFRTTFRTHPDSINLNRLTDGLFIDINEGFTRLTGYTREEVIGKSSLEIDIWADPADRTRLTDELVKTGVVNDLEARFRMKNGDIRVAVMSARVVKVNGEDVILSVTRDITDQRDAIDFLRESEDKYRRLFSLISDAVFLIDKTNGEILEVNDAAERQYGYTREELRGMKNTDLSAEPEATKAATAEQLPVVPLRYHRRKDSTVFPVEIAAAHFQWRGRAVHLAAIRDISFRLQAEQEKADLEERLRQAQKMEAIGTLAGGIAHDFNNILSSVLGFAELSLNDLHHHPVRLDQLQDNLMEILSAGKRARDLIRQILTFSRQAEQEMKPIELSLIVKEVAKMLRSAVPTTIDIGLEIRTPGSTIKADPSQMHQVIMNLCTNAVHAMEQDGGRLLIGLDRMEPEKSAPGAAGHRSDGALLRLRVRDTGIGISPEALGRVFEPYFTTKDKGKGTGLGLAVVHGIVQSHRGHITVQSEPMKGTTVDVFYPLIEKKAAADKAAPVQQFPTGSASVLLVDDDVAIVKLHQQMLERLGYQATTRTSSLEALEAFKAVPGKYDVVITDMTMPGMTGDRLAEELKRIRPDVPVVICTGYSERISDPSAKALGIDAFLMKPVAMGDMANTLKQILEPGQKADSA